MCFHSFIILWCDEHIFICNLFVNGSYYVDLASIFEVLPNTARSVWCGVCVSLRMCSEDNFFEGSDAIDDDDKLL